MDSKIPIATDNIYKFLATFGLVIVISSMTLLIINSTSTNQTIWARANAIFDLESSQDPKKEDKIILLKKEIEIAVNNRELGKWALSIIFAIGAYSSFEGFRRWHRVIQPVHDEILLLQREKLRAEVASLNKSMQPTAKASAD